jgi:hypothetical protein
MKKCKIVDRKINWIYIGEHTTPSGEKCRRYIDETLNRHVRFLFIDGYEEWYSLTGASRAFGEAERVHGFKEVVGVNIRNTKRIQNHKKLE